MAELDFSHRVEQVPAGAELPGSVQRSVRPEISTIPDWQTAARNYGEATNWMSSVGSAVATRASNAIATKLGNEAGKNPSGDIYPITDFDKTFAQSYQTQAHATLGLQANKLITDSNLEMAKAPRITPELIAKTNKQVSLGLQNIFANAPTEIRPQLESQYGASAMGQTSDLTERMLREQKQDRKANTALSSQVNAENAHSLAMKGDYKAAMAAVEATRKANEADVAAGVSDPILSKTNTDGARQSAYSGKYSHEYDLSRAQGKGEEFLRNLADKKPSDLSDADYPVVVSHVMQYVNQQNSLRKQDQALSIAKFNVSLSQDPLGITGAQIAELNSHLDPIQQQEASLAYVKAIKTLQSKTSGIEKAIASYTDVNEFPRQSSENKNGAWEATYKAMMNRPENIATGMTEDTAKLYAAASAPVAIPGYVTELNAKANTADPVALEAAGQAVNYLKTHNLGQNLSGFGAEQESMLEVYGQLRQTMNPVEAAQKAHEVVYNKSKEQKEANKDALSAYYKTQQNKNSKFSSFGLVGKLIDTSSNLLIRNLPGYNHKATTVFENYFNLTNGDETTSLKLTKQYMNTQYGESNINGPKELMFHPIENIPGIPHDAVGAIQSDIVEQTNKKFIEDKKFYDDNKSDSWYEARQKYTPQEVITSKRIVDSINESNFKHPITGALLDINNRRDEFNNHMAIIESYKKGQPIVIVKHNRSGKEEHFEAVVQANPWGVSTGNPAQPIAGGWDISMKTEHGMQPIALRNPLNSNIQYNPRVDYIKNLYVNTVGLSTLPYFKKEILDRAPGKSLAGILHNEEYQGDIKNMFGNRS